MDVTPRPMDPEFLELQQSLLGQYSLERELGRGGMGIVYLAREVQLDRLVAIKVLPPYLAVRPELRDRFLREARTAAQLSHPNIVPIYRVGEAGPFVFFAMAFVDGQTLTERVRAHGALPARDATRVFRELAWALAYAHARGIVHRDLKPDNILIERDTGRAMLTDFGIAQVSDTVALTGEGRVMGTAHFMSPEQAAGETVDGRSDLYSLGVVAFYIASGRLPFDGSSAQAVLAKHLTQPAPPCDAPGIPLAIRQAIARCLAKLPGDRFASGETLGEAIDRAQLQGKELPVPLRAWVAHNDPLKFAYGAWSFLWGTIGTIGTVTMLVRGRGTLPFDALLLSAAPLVPMALSGIARLRRLMRAGFTLEEARVALRQQEDQRREELAFEYGDRPTPLGRAIRMTTYGVAGATIVTLLATIVNPDLMSRMMIAQVVSAGTMATIAGGVLGTVFPGRTLKPGQGQRSLRAWFWNSPAGNLAARLTGWRLRRDAGAPLLQHATEVAIGMAAQELYEALPAASRERVPELPRTLKALETEAQALRHRLDDPAAGARLASVVSALETIRLDLLKLHAGTSDLHALTEAVQVAQRLGAEVDALVQGQREAAALLAGNGRTP